MTTDTFRLLISYNAHANERMGEVLATLKPEQWKKELGGFFPSIEKLCAHIYSADLNWLRRFAGLRPFAFASSPALMRKFGRDEIPFSGVAEYLSMRRELDEVFSAFARELKDEDLAVTLTYKNWAGQEQSKNYGGLILHVLNHATHHRGMIALYLDMLGVKNDFSNLTEIL